MGLGLVNGILGAPLGLARTLRGLTATFGRLDHEGYSESDTERHLTSDRNLAHVEFLYRVRKLQARCLAGDYAAAIDAAMKAQRLIWGAPANFETADFEFFGALARAGAHDWATGDP